MKKLLSIIFALCMLLPSFAMADSLQKSVCVDMTPSVHSDVLLVDGEPKLTVWTPRDYNPEKKYNIFMFLQGSGENLNAAEVTAGEHCGILIGDIYNSIDADFIVAGVQCGTDFDEITGRILYALSYVADHYNTYAASGSLKDLEKAREHIIIGGISNGGRVATYFVTHYNNLVANAIIMSPTISITPDEGFNLNHLIVCVGTSDNAPCRPAARESYAKLSPYAKKAYFSLYDGRHQWQYWNGQIKLALNFVFDLGEFAEKVDVKEEAQRAHTLVSPLYPCKPGKPMADLQ